MKNLLFTVLLTSLLTLVACSKHSDSDTSQPQPDPPSGPVEFTLFMYMPWSQNLTSDLQRNLSDMQTALGAAHMPGKRIVAFISTSATEAQMIEITSGKRTILKTYTSPQLTTAQGIASILEDVKAMAPAQRFGMTIGCHGTGWLPVGALEIYPAHSPLSFSAQKLAFPVTRYFGGYDIQWQTDVCALAEALEATSTHLDFLLFDVCYMGCVEVAYQLRNVADVTVLSPAEIMGIGMPYNTLGTLLLEDNINWQLFCDKYHRFFSTYAYPYGTISVIDNHSLDALADAMKQLNASYNWMPESLSELQAFGGFYGENIYFDLEQYAQLLSHGSCNDFTAALGHAVIASAHTPSCYIFQYGTLPINHYSGLSTSAPSTSRFTSAWHSTQWAIDTQNQ